MPDIYYVEAGRILKKKKGEVCRQLGSEGLRDVNGKITLEWMYKSSITTESSLNVFSLSVPYSSIEAYQTLTVGAPYYGNA